MSDVEQQPQQTGSQVGAEVLIMLIRNLHGMTTSHAGIAGEKLPVLAVIAVSN
jgi:hypothetical protein